MSFCSLNKSCQPVKNCFSERKSFFLSHMLVRKGSGPGRQSKPQPHGWVEETNDCLPELYRVLQHIKFWGKILVF